MCESIWNTETEYTGMERDTHECHVYIQMNLGEFNDKRCVLMIWLWQNKVLFLKNVSFVLTFDLLWYSNSCFWFRKLEKHCKKHSLGYCDQWHFPPAPSNFVHLGIKLSLCLSVFLSNYSELTFFLTVQACQDITSLKKDIFFHPQTETSPKFHLLFNKHFMLP